MTQNLKWQRPTTWSRETLDGYYYIETTNTSEWNAWTRKGNLGFFSNLKKAKKACQLHNQEK